MYKISNEVIKFMEKIMETWRVKVSGGAKSSAEVRIQRGVFPGDALSALLFVIAMMPLNHILRKCTSRYKLRKSQENINHIMYMDNKQFAKNERELVLYIDLRPGRAVKIGNAPM